MPDFPPASHVNRATEAAEHVAQRGETLHNALIRVQQEAVRDALCAFRQEIETMEPDAHWLESKDGDGIGELFFRATVLELFDGLDGTH